LCVCSSSLHQLSTDKVDPHRARSRSCELPHIAPRYCREAVCRQRPGPSLHHFGLWGELAIAQRDPAARQPPGCRNTHHVLLREVTFRGHVRGLDVPFG
jgi:hypothetical protein